MSLLVSLFWTFIEHSRLTLLQDDYSYWNLPGQDGGLLSKMRRAKRWSLPTPKPQAGVLTGIGKKAKRFQPGDMGCLKNQVVTPKCDGFFYHFPYEDRRLEAPPMVWEWPLINTWSQCEGPQRAIENAWTKTSWWMVMVIYGFWSICFGVFYVTPGDDDWPLVGGELGNLPKWMMSWMPRIWPN